MLRKGDTGDWIGTFIGHKGAVWAATLNKDATKAATGAADFTTTLWDAVTGEALSTLKHKHIVKAVAFSSDCTQLLTGGLEKIVRNFRVDKPESEADIVGTHESGIRKTLFFGENDALCLSASDDKTIRKWDLKTNREVQQIKLTSAVTDMELSEDHKTLLVTDSNRLSIYDATTLQEVKSREMPTSFNSASMHPKKKYIVAGGHDFKLYKLDYNTFEELESHKGHFGPVHVVRFSPDGELYASGSEDGTVRLWQTHIGTNYGLWQCVKSDSSGE